MYSRSISPSCARNVQDIDMVGRKTSNVPPVSRDKFFDAVDGSRRRHGGERENTKFPRKNFFNWSSLVQNGKKVASGLSFSKSHSLFHYSNSNESGGSFFRRTNTVSGEGNFYPRCEISSKFCDSPINDSSKFVSAAPSFRTSSLQGLSYVAALHSGVAQVSHNDLELDQASKVVTSSSIGSKHSGSGNSGCCSPSDVFASFSDDSEDPGSPLFDPILLNAFERALADVDKDCNETNENVSCDSASVSSSTDSLKRKNHAVDLQDKSEHLRGTSSSCRLKISLGASEGILGDCRDKKGFEDARKILEGLLGSSRGRKDSSACKKIFPTESTNPLNSFMSLCPSDGDQKVVLFLTSLRGIRKTYEDCNNVRMLLRSSSVKIDERDVSMHSEYKRELRELLGVSTSLPRLFIKGKYIGGSEEIKRLHEEGVLEKLLEDLPKVTSFRACEACGEMRFVPCTECSGSCKIITDDNKVERCPECNENGLVRCLICC